MLHSMGRTLWLLSCSRPTRSLQRRSERCGVLQWRHVMPVLHEHAAEYLGGLPPC